ncbi:MAG: Ig-like domain repeat protein, partial [Saprospiraceae bacterium]|nr:Ig-like domain repeat protein [Saprospiraceae bacterium]
PSHDHAQGIEVSPDGEKIAFALRKARKSNLSGDAIQLWVVETDGTNLTLLDSYDTRYTSVYIRDLTWSPNSEHIAYSVLSESSKALSIVRSDGGGKVTGPGSGWGGMSWSPDSSQVASIHSICAPNGACNEWEVWISDLLGNSWKVYSSNILIHLYGQEWLNESNLIMVEHNHYEETDSLWLIDTSEQADHKKISDSLYEVAVRPDKEGFALIEDNENGSAVTFVRKTGETYLLHDSPFRNSSSRYLDRLEWSHDGTKLAFRAWEGSGPEILHIIDMQDGDLSKSFASPELLFHEYVLEWSPGNQFLIVARPSGHYVIDVDNGDWTLLPFRVVPGEAISPFGRYLTYNKAAEGSSPCNNGYDDDLWTMGSLLNLTADLRVTKEKAAVNLSGTATDLYFEGYRLEYADTTDPNNWILIKPPSDVPVFDETFTQWVPPHEGTFHVRLTVWDKAGNIAVSRKEVSWGSYSSITNLHKSLEILSPNGDGEKDNVELYYNTLEPVHLEFVVLDQNNNLVRTITRDHTSPTEDFISWDGRDEGGEIIADGKYKIQVFDYTFFVEVDNSPPDVDLQISEIRSISPHCQYTAQSPEDQAIYANLLGHAVDENLKGWVIEYGLGDNPNQWYELMKGEDQEARKDSAFNIIVPVENEIIERYEFDEIAFLVGKRLRITAEDFAGNKSSVITNHIEGGLFLYKWDGKTFLCRVDSRSATGGIHELGGLVALRSPLDKVNLQYRSGSQWFDVLPELDPISGLVRFKWDHSALNPGEGYAVRLKAIDEGGLEYYSNILEINPKFDIKALCAASVLEARNELFENLTLLTLSVKSGQDERYSEWTDYLVYDSAKGDVIREGLFYPLLPDVRPDTRYDIRLRGVGVNGEIYESITQYPKSECPLIMSLDVDYPETECGLTSNQANLSVNIEKQIGEFDFQTLSYYLEDGEEFQLLSQYDLSTEGWNITTIDTSQKLEGNYPVKAIVAYLINDSPKELTLPGTLSVDRVLPAAEITYPSESLSVCPIRVSDGGTVYSYGISVEGIADDDKEVSEYRLYYGAGENPSEWLEAMTYIAGERTSIKWNGSIEGQIGLWDVTGLTGTNFSLQLEVIDTAGNVSCDETSISVDTLTEIINLSTDNELFSPNGDGEFDLVNVTYEIAEYANVDVVAYKLTRTEDGSYVTGASPVKTLVSGLQHLSGIGNISWDGSEDSGEVVSDGQYRIFVLATDACGNTSQEWVDVEVDNTPPAVNINYPLPGDAISNILEVKGTASDQNFQDYILAAGQAEYAPIEEEDRPVEAGSLGRWNTFGLEGLWTLRLTATDLVGNRREVTVQIDMGTRKDLIKELDVLPGLFSPNNDGKLETSTIHYEVTTACEIAIEILDMSDGIQRLYTTTAPAGGLYSYTWDGKDNAGNVVSDGSYLIKLSAVLLSNASITQEEAVSVIADTVNPVVDIIKPENDSYLPSHVIVNGTISDLSLQEYAITYSGNLGQVMLDHAKQSREDHVFGAMRDLPEGEYTLHVLARDLGENVTQRDIIFTIDKTPPKVTIDSPTNGEFYGL